LPRIKDRSTNKIFCFSHELLFFKIYPPFTLSGISQPYKKIIRLLRKQGRHILNGVKRGYHRQYVKSAMHNPFKCSKLELNFKFEPRTLSIWDKEIYIFCEYYSGDVLIQTYIENSSYITSPFSDPSSSIPTF
jgi:hypothetical protein